MGPPMKGATVTGNGLKSQHIGVVRDVNGASITLVPRKNSKVWIDPNKSVFIVVLMN